MSYIQAYVDCSLCFSLFQRECHRAYLFASGDLSALAGGDDDDALVLSPLDLKPSLAAGVLPCWACI